MLAFFRFYRCATTWVALCAALTLALVPTLSHALAHVQGKAAWLEVCTATGTKMVNLAGEDLQGSAAHSATALDHCPACGVVHLVPPPEPVQKAVLDHLLNHAVPALFLAAPRPLFAWAPAQARAPPVGA